MIITVVFTALRSLTFGAVWIFFMQWDSFLMPSADDQWLLFPLFTLEVFLGFLLARYLGQIALDEVEKVVRCGYEIEKERK